MRELVTTIHRLTGETPGRIVSSGQTAGLGPAGTVWFEIQRLSDGTWLYSTDRSYRPRFEPPPKPAATVSEPHGRREPAAGNR